MRPAVGVLALQGASEPHRAAFARLGVEAREVRAPHDLDGLTHLVLPGGESTTLHRLLALFGLWDELRERHRDGRLALFGTCAGAILLSRAAGEKPPTLALLDADVERNAYGRQVDSFTRPIELEERCFPGVFIRAPRFTRVGALVRVLARDGEHPLALEAPGLLATTFHPELTDDPWFHRRFIAAGPGARAPGPGAGADRAA
jgi:5'-phosphate synthase pdxT subunit